MNQMATAVMLIIRKCVILIEIITLSRLHLIENDKSVGK